MIHIIENEGSYNPVRDHIRMNFEFLKDGENGIDRIARDLLDQQFDPEKSRVLIFVRKKKETEEGAAALKEALEGLKVDWWDKVGSFHGGMDSYDREQNYENFQSGSALILLATKAFGMGMDIKNVHYVYHLGPSSSFEDYLQEVGRAGRDKCALEVAGFSNAKPIQTKCILTKEDFGNLRDLNHKSSITWEEVKKVRKSIFDYIGKYEKVQANPSVSFPLPLDLLSTDVELKNVKSNDKDTLFRLSLFWLEKLGRVRQQLYVPAFIPIKIEASPEYLKIKNIADRQLIEGLVKSIKEYKEEEFKEAEMKPVPAATLRHMTGKFSNSEVYRLLFKAQQVKAIQIVRNITLEPTGIKSGELEAWNKNMQSYSLLTVEAAFSLAEKLLGEIDKQSQKRFDGDYLDQLIKEGTEEHFSIETIFWARKQNEQERQKVLQKQREDFITKRAKTAFRLLSWLPKVKHRSVVEGRGGGKKAQVEQLIYNGYSSKDQWQKPLRQLKKTLIELISHVVPNFYKNNTIVYNYADLVIRLGLEDQDPRYLDNAVFFSKALGYLKGDGSFIPMGVELIIDDISEIEETVESSDDWKVHKEFMECIELKKLRLLALECLSELDVSKQNDFINSFFICEHSKDLDKLLVDHLGEGHPRLNEYRQQALQEAETKLNTEQKAVYEAPVNTNIQVIAGPGSGKTHTLILRVARLIEKEKVNPDEILILAYNRAVVVELKDRLTTLFKGLGYAKLVNRLKVFTFHGFCKYCLENELDKNEFDRWVPAFLDQWKWNPGKITQKLGQIRYVFVDEFQDITSERLELLTKIANPETTRVCVIGDPNQSIYGYERVEAGGSTMSPRPYYDEFGRIYKPTGYNLVVNHRSYPDILEVAEELLSKNIPEFSMPKLKAYNVPTVDNNYCEIISNRESRTDWKNKLSELLEEEYESDKKYRHVALMFRSNEEVFRAFNILQYMDLSKNNVRIRIQGASTSPYRSREFFYFVEKIRAQSSNKINEAFFKRFESFKNETIKEYPNWDKYLFNLLHCFLHEFRVEMNKDSTYQDLISFLEDIADKDDGHYAKIYEKYIGKVDAESTMREVVLTTMHKVKGVEFDAVLIPPSFSDFASKEEETSDYFKQLVEEERRLFYVAYTRAKYRLVVIKDERELAIEINSRYQCSSENKKKLGVPVSSELDKLFISWVAQERNQSAFEKIRSNIHIGGQIELRNGNYGWEVWSENFQVGRLTSNQLKKVSDHKVLTGYRVSNVVCYTYSESKDYDLRNNTDYTIKYWGTSAIKRGYIYLVNFSGYGKEKTN